MKNKKGHYKLKKALGLFELSLYGVGIILGAGIYALIGVGAGIAGNAIWDHQKGGIVTNGPGTNVEITGNTVTGFGPVSFIAQNGIQVGYGASASVMRNTVTGHSYTGTSTVSGGRDTVALRVPDHPVPRRIARELGDEQAVRIYTRMAEATLSFGLSVISRTHWVFRPTVRI